MEASQAGIAQGDGQNGQDGGEAQQGPDVSALAEQLGTYGQSMEQMRETLQGMQQFMAQQQDAGNPDEGQPQDLDLSFLDDPQLTPEQLSQQFQSMLDQGVEQRFQQAMQQHLNPLAERVSNMQLTQEAQQLTDEYPELQDPKVAGDVIQASRQYAEMLGQPELAGNPMLWRLVYMGIKAADVANSEGGESPSAAHLEGAGGAGPGGQQIDLAQQIVNGGNDQALGRRALPF
jgi:hypothetical protein